MAPSDPQIPQTISACPKPNPRNIPVMFKIFQNVQYNVVQHKKYVKEMTKLYKKVFYFLYNLLEVKSSMLKL